MSKTQRPCQALGRLFCLFLLSSLFLTHVHAQTIYALSNNNLIAFDAQNPAALTSMVPVSGLAAGQTLAGLDFRPNSGELYAIGYNAGAGTARLYRIDRNTGQANPIGAAPVQLKPDMGAIGFDFNPTVDRIRVTGEDNSNYRMHPVTGAVVATDGDLAFAAADANAGADPVIGTVAYTNSYIGTTATTLFDYDLALDAITTQIPPNNGTLNTVGKAGLMLNPADRSVDMDIYFDPAANINRAFLAANTGASLNDDLYRIDMTTGAATLIGPIGGGMPVSNIAVFIDRTVPAMPTGDLLYALTSGNNLISFDAANPALLRTISPVSGIAAGQVLSGLDFRPATGELYGIGYNAGSGEVRLYTIDLTTGAATAIGMAPVLLKPGMGKIGFDFNPTVDRIRVTGSDNSNFRMHPVTGALAATDGSLAFAAGDINAGKNPSVGAVAYTNSFNGTMTTTLYNYDDSLNIFTTQIPPNNGVLNTVGASGFSLNLSDPSADLDIYYDAATNQNRAYLVANAGNQVNDMLYSVNLMSGAASPLGSVGFGIAVTDVAAFIKIMPVEDPCDLKMSGCLRFEVLSISKNADGDEVYRLRVTNTCGPVLDYVAFELPKGITAVAPASGMAYTAPSGRGYTVRNPNASPFYSIRFKTNAAAISGGQSDIFEYTLPKIADVRYIHVFARTRDGAGYEAYLNTFNCPVQQSVTDNGGQNRNSVEGNAGLLSNGDLLVYPNPNAGELFIDLSAFEQAPVQVNLFSTTGQLVERFTMAAGGVVRMDISASLSNGVYQVVVAMPDGSLFNRRIVLQR